MKGVLDMRLTEREMACAVRLWLKEQQNYGEPIPYVVKVSQSKRNRTFVVELSDAKPA